MDELGFMEAKAETFTRAVLETLDADIPVLAAIKARFDIPFLDMVRTHPNGKLFMITKDNRDQLYEELLPLIKRW